MKTPNTLKNDRANTNRRRLRLLLWCCSLWLIMMGGRDSWSPSLSSTTTTILSVSAFTPSATIASSKHRRGSRFQQRRWFRQPQQQQQQQRKILASGSTIVAGVVVDPVELESPIAARLVEDLEPEMLASFTVSSSGSSSTTTAAATAQIPTVDTSQLLSMGHTQSLFGPPDPYLTAAKSIPPTTAGKAALVQMTDTLAAGSAAGVAADPLSSTSSEAASMQQHWPELAKQAVQDGIRVLDATALRAEPVLPGFTPTRGVLPVHHAPLETPASFAAQVEWSAGFLNVVDKLPEAVFVYCLVEFFFLRPGIDRYKEDVEEEPARAVTESVAVTGVRLAMFVLVAAVTTTIFG